MKSTHSRREILSTAAWMSSSLLFSSPARAADLFPQQPVRLVVPYAPGGSVDIMARGLAAPLSEKWKQQVIVDNKPGASEIIAASTVASSKADGYTLLFGTDVGLQSNEYLFTKLPYSIKSFAPVIRVADSPMLMAVRSAGPFRNVAQIIDAAKASPSKVTYGSSGQGGHSHQILHRLAMLAGVELTHVPYKGGAPSVQAVLAGEVDVTAVPWAAIEPFVKANLIRPVAVSSAQRVPAYSTVPTLAELGYEVDIQVLNAIVAPAGTPRDIVEKIATDVRSIIHTRAFTAQQIDHYGYFALGDTPAEFAAYLAADAPRRRERIKAMNVKLD